MGSPIEFSIPAGGLPQAGWRVALARLEGDRLGDIGGERELARCRPSPKALRAAIASKVPDPLMTGWASSSPQKGPSRSRPAWASSAPPPARRHRPRGRRGRPAGSPRPASARRSRSRRRSRRPSAASRASWAGSRALRADRPHGLQHAGRPAGVDGRVGVALELLQEQVGDRPVVAGGTVVAGDAGAFEQLRPGHPRAVAKAEQDGHRGPPRRDERVLQDRQRRDPAPPPSRIARRPSPGGAKPRPSGPSSHSCSPRPARTAASYRDRRPRAGSGPLRRAGGRSRRPGGGTAAAPRPRPSSRLRRASRTARARRLPPGDRRRQARVTRSDAVGPRADRSRAGQGAPAGRRSTVARPRGAPAGRGPRGLRCGWRRRSPAPRRCRRRGWSGRGCRGRRRRGGSHSRRCGRPPRWGC